MATLAASLAVALNPFSAGAVDQTSKNGCTSPVEDYGDRLTSPPFDTPVGGQPQVTFQGWFEVESIDPDSHDLVTVSYSTSAGEVPLGGLTEGTPANTGGAADIGYSNNGTGAAPTFKTYTFPLPAGLNAAQLHFDFSAVDSAYNGFRGFAIDNLTGALTETFEAPQGWNFDSAVSPGAPFWHTLSNQDNVFVKNPEINPDLVTLSDSGALPATPQGNRFAWFGDNASGTFCGPDFANRTPENPPAPPGPPGPPNPGPRTLADLPNPALGQTVNTQVLSGQVLIGVPAGAAASGRRAGASQKGLRFVPLTQVRQIPVGSFLDTRKGKLRVQSATNAQGARQNGDFSSGLFQVLQSRRTAAKGLTELRLKGSSFASCKKARRSRGAQASASRRIRRLSSNTRGRFSTRGRHSSATVRGTKWTITDRCDGTLTQVSRGSVAVRDFRRKKTIVVKAGKKYLARASR